MKEISTEIIELLISQLRYRTNTILYDADQLIQGLEELESIVKRHNEKVNFEVQI